MSDIRDLLAVEGFSGELELLVRVLQHCTWEWRQELEEIDEDGLQFQENGDGRSIGVLLFHLADCEDWWIREVAAGQPASPEIRKRFLSEETDQYGGHWPKPPRYSLQEYYAILDEVRAQTLTILRELGDPDLVSTRPDTTRQYTLRWIVTRLAQHGPYHAGQMVMLKQQYMRNSKNP